MKDLRSPGHAFVLLGLILSMTGCAYGSKVDTDGLGQAFAETFKGDFEIVSQRVTTDEFDLPWWLVEIRPRRAGFFVIRYDAAVDAKHDPEKRDRTRYEFYFDVGAAGAVRTIDVGYGEQSMHPMACVGDTLVVPIDVKPQLSSQRFFREAADPRIAGIYVGYEEAAVKEQGARRRFSKAPGSSIENQSAEHLALAGIEEGTAMAESMGVGTRELNGLFEARKPGSFNFRVVADGHPADAGSIAMRIVAKSAPISVLLLHADHYDFFGKNVSETSSQALSLKPTGTVVAREGDLLAIPLWSQRVIFRLASAAPATQPSLRIEQRPFAAQPWPFE